MIIDRKIVITGSFNFTRAAEENNAENVLIIRSKELAGDYL
jgi:phosphatidylserine/phosphatidylglycerophosphate/cardiolipin synthase-like enzyme